MEQVKISAVPRVYTWSVYKKQRYGYTVAHERTYRQIYEASTGSFEVTMDAAKNQTEILLTKIQYPHITDVLLLMRQAHMPVLVLNLIRIIQIFYQPTTMEVHHLRTESPIR